MSPRSDSPRAVASLFARRMAVMATLLALVVTVAPPLIYGLLLRDRLQAQADTASRVVVRDLSAVVLRQPVLWRYRAPKELRASAQGLALPSLAQLRVTDCQHQTVWASVGDAPQDGAVRSWAPLRVGDRVMGWVEISMHDPDRGQAVGRLWVGSLLLGLLLGLLLYTLPTRLMRRQATRLAEAEESLLRANEGLQRRVEEGVQEVRDLSRQVVEIQELERQRIAQDLHDGVGQMLTGLRFVLERPRDDSTRAVELCVDTLGEIKRIVRALQPAELEHQTLEEALRDLVEQTEARSGIAASFRHRGLTVQDPERALCLLRVCQEALQNAQKHARCSEVGVVLTVTEDTATLEVSDDGVGFMIEQTTPGVGLPGMRRRLALLSGQFLLSSSPEEGTHLTATLPLL